jgi:hypothetical protein
MISEILSWILPRPFSQLCKNNCRVCIIANSLCGNYENGKLIYLGEQSLSCWGLA